MSFEGTFSFPHMEIDGVLKKVSASQWAAVTLSTEDYAKFEAAAERDSATWTAAEAAGHVVKTVTSDGMHFVINETVENDEEYAEFMQRMLADPAVTWPGPGIKPIY